MPSIMIVEDEVLIAEDIKDSLTSQGFEVSSVVESGEEAVSLAGVAKPDAVLMDIRLQGEMDGITAAEYIYTKYKIPCIFLTAFAEPSLLERAKKVGSFGYLLKPFEDFELKAMIEMALYKAEAEGEKMRLETQLRQAMKMEAIGTLAGGIAHDFNNILAIIMGFAELLEGDMLAAGLKTDRVMRIVEASSRARDLIKQILAFSRKSDCSRVPLNLNTIVKEAMQFMNASIPSNIKIFHNLKTDACYIFADPTQIFQVLMNLCTNAAQALEDKGGEIIVSVECIATDSSQLIDREAPFSSSRYVLLSVKDNGPGMDADTQARIFDPYFTTKDIFKGSGLGLAVVYGIVKSHDGIIKVESSPGNGSIFRVFIPEAGTESEQEPTENIGESVPTGTERILLVDDEEMLGEMAVRMLTSLGYRVTAFTSSQEALKVFFDTPNDFDLVITDQAMPDITGIQFASKILAVRNDLPIILCTGYSNIVDQKKAKEIGIKGFMMKPYFKREIAESVRVALDNA